MDAVDALLRQAVDLAMRNVRDGGRPFAALVVRDGKVIGSGVNEIAATGDPTAHAELQAIRAAARAIGGTRLDGCTMVSSGHPCPMCLSAMYLTGIARVHYAYSLDDGEPYGLSTASLYADLAKPAPDRSIELVHQPIAGASEHLYDAWQRMRTDSAS